jgi:putative phosphoribosyl transferase
MFSDRRDAGRRLGERLGHLRGSDTVVLGLPRGGVIVAAEIAEALGAPLDVLVVRKLGAPAQPELAIGAVTDGERPQTILNDRVIRAVGATPDYLEEESRRQLDEVRRRQALYRGGRPARPLAGRCAVVVDDGIATGATVRAGIQALRRQDVRRVVLAVPVAPQDTAEALRREVDELVCLHAPKHFAAVGAFYADFSQATDEEVIAALADAAPRA